jgi:hypothetical protein
MRLNPFYPSDDPMSSVFYCFGGGKDNDGSGGSRVSYDVDEDAPVGRNSGSGGRGGNDKDNDSSRQEIAARAGVPADTIVGSGPQGSGVVTSAGGPVTSARSVAQAAGDLGISDDEVRARINAAASAAPGPSAAAAFDQAIAEQEAYDAAFNIFDTPQFQELQATNISLMDQLEDLQQGINMRKSEFDALSARYDGLAPLATFNIVPELNTQLDDLNSQLAGKQDEILGLQTRLDDTFKSYTDLQGQFGAQSDQLTALDEQFGLSQQQIQDQAARIAEQEEAARRNRILGIAGVSPVASSAMTQGDVYNMFGGPGPGSSVEMQNRILGGSGGFSTRPSVTDPNRSILSLGGREYSFDNTVPGNQRSYTEISSPSIGGVTGALLDTPEFQAEFDAFNSLQKMPAGGVDTRSFAEKVAAGEIPEDIFVYGASAPSGDEILTFGLDDFNTGITPNPIESQISIANALKNLGLQAEEEKLFSPVNMPGFIGAGINLIGGALNAAQKYGGGNIPGYAQDVMNRPGGAPIMANAPMMSPAQPSAFLETLMAASDRQPVGPYSEAEGVPDVLGGFGPNQLSFLPGEPDNIYVGDPRGIEQAQMLDPNVQVLDENYFSQGQELSDRGGDQAAPPALTLPDPVTQECPEGYTRDGSGICVYEGQPRVGVTPYTPMAPVEFSYTGLPSLAPRTLTPTAPNLSFLNRR